MAVTLHHWSGQGACEPVTKTSLQLEEAVGKGGVRAQPGGELEPRVQDVELGEPEGQKGRSFGWGGESWD